MSAYVHEHACVGFTCGEVCGLEAYSHTKCSGIFATQCEVVLHMWVRETGMRDKRD